MAYRAPGKHFRHGISTKEFFKIFPDDETAEYWFIAHRWPDGIRCPYCGSDNINTESKHKTMWKRLQHENRNLGIEYWHQDWHRAPLA